MFAVAQNAVVLWSDVVADVAAVVAVDVVELVAAVVADVPYSMYGFVVDLRDSR